MHIAFLWKNNSATPANKHTRFRPQLEALEQRLAPATFTVDDDGVQNPNRDFTTIQAAVDAASAGDTIKVFAGTYTESVTVDVKNLRIRGAQSGASAATRVGAGGFPSALQESIVVGTGAFGFKLTADGVRLDGFVIQNTTGSGIETAADTSGHALRNNVIQGNSIGISLHGDGDRRTIVQANVIRNNDKAAATAGYGIYSNLGLSNAQITGNQFSGHDESAMAFTGGIGNSNAQSELQIDRNRSDGDADGIFLFNTTDSIIESNAISKVTGAAILFGGSNSNNQVRRNTLGILPSDVTDEPVIEQGNFGVLLDDLSAEFSLAGPNPNQGNRIYRNSIGGFKLAAIALAENSIANVVARNFAFHIGYDAVDVASIHLQDNAENNRITRNVLTNNGVDGIRAEVNTTNNTIVRNKVSSNGDDLRDLSSGTGTAGTDNFWEKNIAADSDPQGLIG